MWDVFRFEVQGRSHALKGIPCQDKTFSNNERNVYTVALADGAGSARLSHLGAESAVKIACQEMSGNFEAFYSTHNYEEIAKSIIDVVVRGLKRLSDRQSCLLEDLASTLLIVAADNEKYIAVHLGDGVIGAVKKSFAIVVSEPENGEYINTTYFTTSQNAYCHVRIYKGSLDDIEGFVLMSDGTAESFYDRPNCSIAPVVCRLLDLQYMLDRREYERLFEEDFNRIIIKKTMDDCSTVFMRKGELFSGYTKLDIMEKAKIWGIGISDPKMKRRMLRYEQILRCCDGKWSSIMEIHGDTHIPVKSISKYIAFMEKSNFMIEKNHLFHTTIKM